jgi:hypothetical protein
MSAYADYIAADDAWVAAMRADPIARRTVNARYLPAGKGAPGSPLREAHDRREAARLRYARAIDPRPNRDMVVTREKIAVTRNLRGQ